MLITLKALMAQHKLLEASTLGAGWNVCGYEVGYIRGGEYLIGTEVDFKIHNGKFRFFVKKFKGSQIIVDPEDVIRVFDI